MFAGCILLLLRINSTLFLSSAHDVKGVKVCLPHVNQSGIYVIVVASLKHHLIHFNHSSTYSCHLLS